MEKIEFRLNGPNATQLSEELSSLLEKAFETKIKIEPIEDNSRSSDFWAIVGCVLMLPPTIDSGVKLWNSKEVQALLDWGKAKVDSSDGLEVTVISQDGLVENLDKLDPQSLRDHLTPPSIEDPMRKKDTLD